MSEFKFNPDLKLEREEVSYLAALIPQPGFKVLQKIFRSSIDQFTVQMLNVSGSNEKEVLEAHRVARTAAQYYTWVIERINNEVVEYVHSDPGVTATTENLDIDNVSELENEESLF